MHQTWTNLRKFSTARFTVTLDYTWEDCPDVSWDETGETADKIASGEWGNYIFRVLVLCDDREVAVDYLGNSVYADPADFGREHIGARGKYDSYFIDMVHQAIDETRKALANTPRLRCVAA